MNYELAKKLKEAGFKQEYKLGQWACKHGLDKLMENSCSCYGDMLFYAPALSELIEACGNSFDILSFNRLGDQSWTATGWIEDSEFYQVEHCGSTPEEAVANLWLKLNNK